jgi:hypothetical protein
MKNLKDIKAHGQYIPKNSKKYVGRYPLIPRSSWERSFMQWLDANPNVLEWSSESIYIIYFDPVSRRKRKYFPDFYMLLKDSNGKIQQYIIEIKPFKYSHPPSNRGNKSRKTLLYEQKTWATNEAKWNAAIQWCSKMNMVFHILTEKELFGKK